MCPTTVLARLSILPQRWDGGLCVLARLGVGRRGSGMLACTGKMPWGSWNDPSPPTTHPGPAPGPSGRAQQDHHAWCRCVQLWSLGLVSLADALGHGKEEVGPDLKGLAWTTLSCAPCVTAASGILVFLTKQRQAPAPVPTESPWPTSCTPPPDPWVGAAGKRSRRSPHGS